MEPGLHHHILSCMGLKDEREVLLSEIGLERLSLELLLNEVDHDLLLLEDRSDFHHKSGGLPVGAKLEDSADPLYYMLPSTEPPPSTTTSTADLIAKIMAGFMVVGVMTGRGVLPLIKVPSKVKVNSEFYIECVLKPVIEQLKDLYPGEMDKVFLHHDKASSHTSNKTQQFLQEMKDTLGLNFIRNSDIPVKSPDASPLDFYGFGMLKQRLFNRRPKTEAGLWKAAQEEWSNVSLSKVKEVFAAWKVRCREIAKKKGKHIEHMKKIHVRKIKF
ncbi:IKK1 [Cordylochernes scorpioides]|uniref:IKK1 n=1 Tax=Cordylochernes scorpioides TaxID=51811 RepID=A0ABY6KSQ3_9ARAC|nr:IKK1 [Cordylochernes scorpioides]